MSKLTDVLSRVEKEKHVVECHVGSRTIRFETGEVAKQAGGAVLVSSGETVVLVTVCASPMPRLAQVVVLAVPPFWLARLITCASIFFLPSVFSSYQKAAHCQAAF